jgi:hypothetical protein
VEYAVLDNLQPVGAAVHTLIDVGLALDSDLGLYVADIGLGQILRYQLKTAPCDGSTVVNVIADANNGINFEDAVVKRLCAGGGSAPGPPLALMVDGSPTAVAMGTNAAWVSTDASGALYYSDQIANSVNRISPGAIRSMMEGTLTPDAVKHLSAADVQGQIAANSNMASSSNQITGVTALETAATIYQAGTTDHVGVPAGIAVDGSSLFFANQASGYGNGSVVVGLASPLDANGAEGGVTAMAMHALANSTDSAHGLAVTSNKVIFTGNQHAVYATDLSGGIVTTLTDTLDTPRGLAWDGDGTVFVADEDASMVFSFPCGKLTARTSLAQVLTTPGPFGLAVMQVPDLLASSASRSSSTSTDTSMTSMWSWLSSLR